MLRHMTAFASHVTATRLGCQCRSNRNVADTAGIQWMQTPKMQPSHGRHTSTARPLDRSAAQQLHHCCSVTFGFSFPPVTQEAFNEPA
jgi:hypothetical protein